MVVVMRRVSCKLFYGLWEIDCGGPAVFVFADGLWPRFWGIWGEGVYDFSSIFIDDAPASFFIPFGGSVEFEILCCVGNLDRFLPVWSLLN